MYFLRPDQGAAAVVPTSSAFYGKFGELCLNISKSECQRLCPLSQHETVDDTSNARFVWSRHVMTDVRRNNTPKGYEIGLGMARAS